MAKKKIPAQQVPKYEPPPTEFHIYVRRKGWLQPIPYAYKKLDLTPLIKYAKEHTKSSSPKREQPRTPQAIPRQLF